MAGSIDLSKPELVYTKRDHWIASERFKDKVQEVFCSETSRYSLPCRGDYHLLIYSNDQKHGYRIDIPVKYHKKHSEVNKRARKALETARKGEPLIERTLRQLKKFNPLFSEEFSVRVIEQNGYSLNAIEMPFAEGICTEDERITAIRHLLHKMDSPHLFMNGHVCQNTRFVARGGAKYIFFSNPKDILDIGFDHTGQPRCPVSYTQWEHGDVNTSPKKRLYPLLWDRSSKEKTSRYLRTLVYLVQRLGEKALTTSLTEPKLLLSYYEVFLRRTLGSADREDISPTQEEITLWLNQLVLYHALPEPLRSEPGIFSKIESYETRYKFRLGIAAFQEAFGSSRLGLVHFECFFDHPNLTHAAALLHNGLMQDRDQLRIALTYLLEKGLFNTAKSVSDLLLYKSLPGEKKLTAKQVLQLGRLSEETRTHAFHLHETPPHLSREQFLKLISGKLNPRAGLGLRVTSLRMLRLLPSTSVAHANLRRSPETASEDALFVLEFYDKLKGEKSELSPEQHAILTRDLASIAPLLKNLNTPIAYSVEKEQHTAKYTDLLTQREVSNILLADTDTSWEEKKAQLHLIVALRISIKHGQKKHLIAFSRQVLRCLSKPLSGSDLAFAAASVDRMFSKFHFSLRTRRCTKRMPVVYQTINPLMTKVRQALYPADDGGDYLLRLTKGPDSGASTAAIPFMPVKKMTVQFASPKTMTELRKSCPLFDRAVDTSPRAVADSRPRHSAHAPVMATLTPTK